MNVVNKFLIVLVCFITLSQMIMSYADNENRVSDMNSKKLEKATFAGRCFWRADLRDYYGQIRYRIV